MLNYTGTHSISRGESLGSEKTLPPLGDGGRVSTETIRTSLEFGSWITLWRLL